MVDPIDTVDVPVEWNQLADVYSVISESAWICKVNPANAPMIAPWADEPVRLNPATSIARAVPSFRSHTISVMFELPSERAIVTLYVVVLT